MTHPSPKQPFDTSLMDISQDPASVSFSTTESVSSTEYKKAALSIPEPMRISTPKFEEASTTTRNMPTRYVPTVDAYDAWADVYDSDGNVLQAIDDYELGPGGMLANFAEEAYASREQDECMQLLDLGCGTGRNTVKLLQIEWPSPMQLKLTGIDASAGMLAKAEEKLLAAKNQLVDDPTKTQRVIVLRQYDFLANDESLDVNRPPFPLPQPLLFDGLITTLVLEHFPLDKFFGVLKTIVKPNGVVMLTNMHDEMGNKSQAGFVSQDEKTGEAIKVRGTSWVHSVKETVDAAEVAGFTIIGDVKERGVTQGMIDEGIVSERAKKWIGVNMWYGMILRKTS